MFIQINILRKYEIVCEVGVVFIFSFSGVSVFGKHENTIALKSKQSG